MSQEYLFGSVWEEFRVEAVNGNPIEDGPMAFRIEIAKGNSAFYQFPAVILWKLMLEQAMASEKKAVELLGSFNAILQNERAKNKGEKIYKLQVENCEDFSEYLKAIISAYVFSFIAIEAYINMKLDSFNPTPEDYLALPELVNADELLQDGALHLCTVKTDPLWESLVTKVFRFLPYYLNKKGISLSGIESFRPDLKNFKSIRNSLTHIKRLDIRSSRQEDGSFKTAPLWDNLLPRFNRDGARLRFAPAEYATKLIKFIEDQCSMKKAVRESSLA